MTSRRSRERLFKARGPRPPPVSLAGARRTIGPDMVGVAAVGVALGLAAFSARRSGSEAVPTAGETGQSAKPSAIETADVEIAAKAAKARHEPAVRALGAASEIADQLPSFALCGSILAYGLAARRPRVAEAGAGLLASVLVAAALKSGVKAVVSRTRPHAVLDGEGYAFEIGGRDGPHDHSFPSGHTAGAVAAARHVARVYPAAASPAYLAAAAIALVQVPRAKHYPADLAAGAAVGIVSEALVAGAASLLIMAVHPGEAGARHAPVGDTVSIVVQRALGARSGVRADAR